MEGVVTAARAELQQRARDARLAKDAHELGRLLLIVVHRRDQRPPTRELAVEAG